MSQITMVKLAKPSLKGNESMSHTILKVEYLYTYECNLVACVWSYISSKPLAGMHPDSHMYC